MSETAALPEWAGHFATLAGVVGTVGAAFLAGWKGWASKAKQGSDAPNTLVAGDIMDTKPMKELVVATTRQAEALSLMAAAQDRAAAASDRAAAASDRAAEAAHRSEDAMRDLCRVLERKL